MRKFPHYRHHIYSFNRHQLSATWKFPHWKFFKLWKRENCPRTKIIKITYGSLHVQTTAATLAVPMIQESDEHKSINNETVKLKYLSILSPLFLNNEAKLIKIFHLKRKILCINTCLHSAGRHLVFSLFHPPNGRRQKTSENVLSEVECIFYFWKAVTPVLPRLECQIEWGYTIGWLKASFPLVDFPSAHQKPACHWLIKHSVFHNALTDKSVPVSHWSKTFFWFDRRKGNARSRRMRGRGLRLKKPS